MATMRLEIYFHKQPDAGQGFAFVVAVDGTELLAVSKTFGAAAADVIAVGATLGDTLDNVAANLTANDAAAGVAYSENGVSAFVDIDADGMIVVSGLAGVEDYFSLYVIDPETDGLADFEVHELSVEIIDTHDNELDGSEEFTQPNAPELSYDGGQDLYAPFMPSKLAFNLAVPDAADAKFLHLLTGDEKRYLVKVRNTDYFGNVQLLWQGFILPDLYSEPWKNGVPFIAFTATDMIASLKGKGKTFRPWYYEQVYTLPDLFARILAQTGLAQEMYVRPALVNVSHGEAYRWRDINVSLKQFTDGKKYDDLYTILETVLKAQGLQLFSWRGKWFFEGLTRRQELSGLVEVYRPDGYYKETVTVEHPVAAPLYSPVPNLTAETPWKTVALDYEADDAANLLPEEIVKKKFYATETYMNGSGSAEVSDAFVTTYLKQWKLVGGPFLYWSNDTWEILRYWANGEYLGGTSLYDVNEATALVNYFEALAQPFVAAGRTYEIELEVRVLFNLTDGGGNFEDDLLDGVFDGVICFQLFHNGAEFMSNRPSFAEASSFVMEKESRGAYAAGAFHEGIFRFKREFAVADDGFLTLRLLSPIGDISELGYSYFNITPTTVKINVPDETAELESGYAVRDINFTKTIDETIDISCSVDTSVTSFGIAPRVADRFFQIPVGAITLFYGHHFSATAEIQLELYRWAISLFVQDFVFRYDNQKTMFLKKADGSEIAYGSAFTKTLSGVRYMAVMKDYEADPQGKPVLPKGFEKLDPPAVGDTLWLMISLFSPEDITKRALWKVYGFDDATAQSYLRTLAYAMHCVRPDTCFTIECSTLEHNWPLQQLLFTYDGAARRFIPTSFSIALFEGKTRITAMAEAKLTELTDVTYE